MRYYFSVLLALLYWGVSAQSLAYSLVPNPEFVETQSGIFTLDKLYVSGKTPAFSPFKEWLAINTQASVVYKGKKAPGKDYKEMRYTLNPALPAEAYELNISPGLLEIRAAGAPGFLYAEQTLIQLFEQNANRFVPCLIVRDHPRFAWRGMHLDESRHFMGKDFVKKYIDWLFSLKMNVFHWHLTDAQGWRIEIKKYPKLSSVAAWRPDRTGLLNSDADTAAVGEAMTYGGFYTQADIREIVQYAAKRNITIIPEIEMPGHTTAALVAYPEFSCSGGPFPMPGGAKNCVYPNFCVGNEKTYTFLEDILTEVMALFPSSYIHIGGDEVEREQWKHCALCQAKKNALGLKDEAQLQVYFTKRIESFLLKKGRRLMGWDEIMEGGDLTNSAGVMVWRGEQAAREATAAGHEVVIAHNYYFDLYQGSPAFEPVSYGYLPLEQVYAYEPVPADFSAEQRQKVLGVEGCLWSENIYNTQKAEYMLFPRLLALSEVAWTPPGRRNWNEFKRRLPSMMDRLEKHGVHYATSIFDPVIRITPDTASKTQQCRLEQQISFGDIYYTVDGSEPSTDSRVYREPFFLQKSSYVRAQTFLPDGKKSKMLSIIFHPSLASGKNFKLAALPAEKYNGKASWALTDGLNGTEAIHDGRWCGFYGDDFDITLDLDSVRNLRSLELHWMKAENSWIYLPVEMRVETSIDGEHWSPAGAWSKRDFDAAGDSRIIPVKADLAGVAARYVRIFAKNPGQHPVYPDGKCWLFIDEVRIN